MNKNAIQNTIFDKIKPTVEPEVANANIKIKKPINRAIGKIKRSNDIEYLNPLYQSFKIFINGRIGFSSCSTSALIQENIYPTAIKLISVPEIKQTQYCQGKATVHLGHGGRRV